MKVFVTGATGVVGPHAVRALVADGHEVTAVARSAPKADVVRACGARPVQVDLFDPAAVKEAVAGHEVVMHLATNIPPPSRALRPSAWATNDRLRSEASTNLLEGALATGATRFVQESICFPYVDQGDRWIDEDAERSGGMISQAVDVAEANAARATAAGSTGVVLRYAMFYGPGSTHVDLFHRVARRGFNPFLGRPEAYISFIHAEDAGGAAAAALRAPAGTYNVADDEPLTRAGAGAVVADALGRRRLRQVPGPLLRLVPSMADYLLRSHRVSNRRFRDATGWAPAHPSIRTGWATVVAP